MASTIGGSGSGRGGRRFREERLEVGTVDRAEQRGAVKRARVSAGASRSGGMHLDARVLASPWFLHD